ncbi:MULTISPECIES: SAM-dependent methyltransferase [unclassified Streptomyces]|uniref:SAM-dependent methyltransferase n=1 Tax=unclassified Streptomyces TaxID=2593676 RepID=UPI000DDB5A9C|nr:MULTISPECIES: SAM-dependent methyltransferase [unclassified Streptomyces]QZZ26031.1 SAM-dependent methyltransferase [Streptomyces sp. ST1015]
MRPGERLSMEIDAAVPTAARMYDHYLGGKDNYAADRAACEQLDQVVPSTRALALNNRRFLQRVVRTLAQEYGVRQFLDHGSGLPTQDNVHQVAQRVDPQAHVVYVDNDPMVLVHGRALLEEDGRTAVIHADMRRTEEIFTHPDTERLIDFSRPVAVLFNSVFHCIPDDEADGPEAVVRRVVERLAPGSFLVMCQLVSEDAEVRKFVTDFMDQATQGHWGRVRRERDVAAWFEGLEILEPGLVEVSTWRPDTEVAPRQQTLEWIEFGGLGRIPG